MTNPILKQSFSNRLEQKLILTKQMQNAFEVLQMQTLDLKSYIQKEVDQNPLLFYAENHSSDKKVPLSCPIRSTIGANIASHCSHYELLLQEIGIALESKDKKIAQILMGSMDEKGFLSDSLEDLSALFEIPLARLTKVKDQIQSLIPNGLLCQNLRESLLFQLSTLSKKTCTSYRVISDYFEDLLSNNFGKLSNELQIPIPTIKQEIKQDLGSLCFYPLSSYQEERVCHIIPDLFITQEDDKLEVSLNDEFSPKLEIQKKYLEKAYTSKEEKNFVQDCNTSAKWLFKTLNRRNSILLSIGKYLTNKQYDYLQGNTDHLKPITMREVASALELNESTITRAVKNKYVSSPKGTFPLRKFFTSALINKSGEKISNSCAKDLLIKLIQQEDKTSPLSDEAISSHLQEYGIPCARRTIAKYRKQLNIHPSNKRKIW